MKKYTVYLKGQQDNYNIHIDADSYKMLKLEDDCVYFKFLPTETVVKSSEVVAIIDRPQ
jgi:hypothetical protein